MPAFIDGFSNRFILAFKQRQELLPQTVITEGVAEGQTYKFMVGDDGSDEATTRGANGLIQYSAVSRSQYSVTMVEWIAAHRETGFNIFKSQGPVEKVMHDAVIGKINRKKDQVIISALNTGTVNTGAATPASFSQVQKGQTTLQNAGVPQDGQITLLITPAYLSYMQQWTEFNNANLVGTSALPLANGQPSFTDQIQYWKWNGKNVIVHPKLPGNGTAAEKCFLYHKNAVGLGFNMDAEKIEAGWNGEHRFSFVNQETYIGATVLQNSGIVVINHDGSALQL